MLAALLVSAVVATDKVWVDSSDRVLRDPEHRQLIFHGVNVVYKVAPYIPEEQVYTPETSLTDSDIADLKAWGFNFVRLGVIWEAVETAPGVYNDTYLSEIDILITKLGEAGIYTLVDAHQDVMARINCGEGMPDFYAKEIVEQGTYCIGPMIDYLVVPTLKQFGLCKSISDYNYTKDSHGDPIVKDCIQHQFAEYYLTPESQTMFRALYNNHFEMQDKFVAYWEKVANTFSSNKYVVAYDPFNEPFLGVDNLNDLISSVMPGHYDRQYLTPLYERIFEKYMNASKDNLMMFEPGLIDQLYPVGFEKPPGGQIGSANHILNDHIYCLPDQLTAVVCGFYQEAKMEMRTQDAKRLGIPWIVSEFGACWDTDSCVQEVTQVADMSDEHLVGWAYWQFKNFKDLTTQAKNASEGFYNYDGTIQEKVKYLSRSYVKSAQGTIQYMKFSSTEDLVKETAAGTLEAKILIDTSITAPTVVHALVNELHGQTWYPHGVDVKVVAGEKGLPTLNAQINWSGNDLMILVEQQAFDGKEIIVYLSPKKAQEFIQS